jgi:glutaredoxin-related protein
MLNFNNVRTKTYLGICFILDPSEEIIFACVYRYLIFNLVHFPEMIIKYIEW